MREGTAAGAADGMTEQVTINAAEGINAATAPQRGRECVCGETPAGTHNSKTNSAFNARRQI